MTLALGVPIAIVVLAFVLFGLIITITRNYIKAAPNEVVVLYGRKRTIEVEGQKRTIGYRTISGGAAFRWPILENMQRLNLSLIQVNLRIENTPNIDGVLVTVESVANIKISSERNMLDAAIERFLGKPEQEIHKIITDILEGQLRQIIGTLTVEEIVKEREKISESMLKNAAPDLNKIGIHFDFPVINRISDVQGYIEALGKKRTAEVKRDAEIGTAEAEREAMVKASTARREGEQAKLDNDAKVAEAQRDLDLKKAGYRAQVATKEAEATQAGPIATATWMQNVKEEEAKVQEKEALRKEKELVATIIKPAEAKREATIIEAEGIKKASIIKAEGDATANITTSDGQRKATINIAEAEQIKLTAEGEGKAAAELAVRKATGEGDAVAVKAKGLAEGAAIEAKGLAEGKAIQAKVLAEAEGILKKNEAMETMSDAAKMILILERLPQIIEDAGVAGEKIAAAMFENIGKGVAGIDNVTIVQTGSQDGKGAISNFANNIPDIVFNLIQKARAFGINLDDVLKKIGIDPEKLIGLKEPADKKKIE